LERKGLRGAHGCSFEYIWGFARRIFVSFWKNQGFGAVFNATICTCFGTIYLSSRIRKFDGDLTF